MSAAEAVAARPVQVIKTHWLFGNGPNKEVAFNVDVPTKADETKCGECVHVRVCGRVLSERCANHEFGSSDKGCFGCIHHYTRFDHRQAIPCFHCPDFMARPESIEEDHV